MYILTSLKHITLCFAEVCESLPPDITNLRTETVFPVNHGTVVTVTCSGSLELRGDSEITCGDTTVFNFNEKPKCNNPGILYFSRLLY